MLFNRIVSDAQDQNWFAVIADLLIVVIGLFTGLQVDSWWESYQDGNSEQVYLRELREDFQGNNVQLEGALEDGELILNDMITLSNQALLDEPSMSLAELDEKFSSLQFMQTFSPITRAYDNLVASSDLGIIKNRDLKNAMADFYSFAEVAELIQTTHELQLVEFYLPYMRDNTELARVMISWQDPDDFPLPEPAPESGLLEILNTREFRNIVTDKYYAARDLYGMHEELKEINDELLELIDAEISD